MEITKAILSLSIVAILAICMFDGVAAAPVSKQTTDVHRNYTVDVKGDRQQTYLVAYLRNQTAITIGVDQPVYLGGILDVSPTFSPGRGIPNATVNIQSLNPDGKTWSTVATRITEAVDQQGHGMNGFFVVVLTPVVAGVYTYRVTYDGDSQYAPSVSNIVTLTVTNVAIS
jgi:hypothetical protein